MYTFINSIGKLFGYVNDDNSPSHSDYDDDWEEDVRLSSIRGQLEYYFSGINLEKDKNFRSKIEETHGSVPVSYFLNCNRLKYLNATEEEILEAGADSRYIFANPEAKTISPADSFKFEPDPERYKRILRIKGIGIRVPQNVQYDFLNSVDGLAGRIKYIYLVRKEENGELKYTNETLVEFDSVETAETVLEQNIVYGEGQRNLLEIERYLPQRNIKGKNQKEKSPKEKNTKGKGKRGKKFVESDSDQLPDPDAEYKPRQHEDSDPEYKPEQQEESDPELRQEISDEVEAPQEEDATPEQQEGSDDELRQEPEEVQQEESTPKRSPRSSQKTTPKTTPKKRGPRGRASKPSS